MHTRRHFHIGGALLGLAILLCRPAAGGGLSKAEIQEWDQVRAGMIDLPLAADAQLARINAYIRHYPQSPQTAVAWYLAGEVCRLNRQYAQAEKSYVQSLQSSSDLGDSLYYRLGETYFNRRKYGVARETWQYLLGHYPQSFLRGEALHGLGLIAMAEHDWQAAAQIYQQLLSQLPAYEGREDIAATQGLLDIFQGRPDQALKRLQDRDSTLAQYAKGDSLYRLRNYVEAANYFNRIVKAEPAEAGLYQNAYYQRGEAFLAARDYVSASNSCDGFLEKFSPLHPLKPYVQYQMSLIDFYQGKFTQALPRLDTLEAGGRLPEETIRYLKAECLTRSDQPAKALALYQELAKSADPAMAELAWYKQGWCRFALRDYDGAVKTLQAYLQAYPGTEHAARIHYLLGKAALGQKQVQTAAAIFGDLLGREPSPLTDAAWNQFLILAQQSLKYPELILASENYLSRRGPKLEGEDSRILAQGYYRLAEAYFHQGQFGRSLAGYKKISDDFWDTPVYVYALHGLARCHFRLGDFEACGRQAGLALKIKELPEDMRAELQLLQACCLFNTQKYEDALVAYQKWLKTYPDSAQAPVILYVMGVGYTRMKFFRNALEVWDKLIQAYPGHALLPGALFQSGELYFDGKEYARAIASYRQLVEGWPQAPQRAAAMVKLAQASLNLEDYAGAQQAYEAFLQAAPEDSQAAEARENLEIAAFRQTVKLNTPEAFQAFLARFPASRFSEKVQYTLCDLHYGRQAYAQALPELEKFIQGYPQSTLLAQAYFDAADSADQLQDFPKAVSLYQTFLQKYPDHALAPEAMFRLGVDHFAAQEYPTALQTFADIEAKYPGDKMAPQAAYNRALCYEAMEKPEELLEALKAVAQKYPASPEGLKASARLGLFSHEQKDFPAAIGYLRRVFAAGGELLTPELVYRLGDSYENQNEPANARKCYQAARKLKPADDAFRIVALSQLAALYEKEGNLGGALKLYRDIARNAQDQQWRSAAKERMTLLRRYLNDAGN